MVGGHQSRRLPRRGGCRHFASRMGRQLWGLRQRGGWIDLDFPVAAAVVNGELRSKAEGLGARPRSTSFQRRHISFLETSVYFGSLQSLCAMESSRFWERWRLSVPGGVRWRLMQATTGFLGLFVISVLSRSLCVIWWGQLSSVSYCVVSVFLGIFVRIL